MIGDSHDRPTLDGLASVRITVLPVSMGQYAAVVAVRDQRRQALGGLVQHDQLGVGHSRPADGQHLLSAVRELRSQVRQTLLQAREGLHDALERSVVATIDATARPRG